MEAQAPDALEPPLELGRGQIGPGPNDQRGLGVTAAQGRQGFAAALQERHHGLGRHVQAVDCDLPASRQPQHDVRLGRNGA